MSLIPYHPREGREIVLRHRNAVVVRDPDSHRLEIRGAECPTCHQPLGRTSTPEQPYDAPFGMNSDSYVDPGYFRMLRTGDRLSESGHAPSSPIQRFFKPALGSSSRAHSATSDHVDEEAEFVSSTPGVGRGDGGRIRREAFSPNYFKTFFVEEKVLGKGGKGVVLLVRHEIDGCQLGHFACKRVPVGDDHAWLEKVLIEVELLAKLSHPNLVSYRHVWLEDVQLTMFGPSVASAFILQQYCNSGDLHQYVVGSAPREATKEELKEQMRRRSKGHPEPPRNLFQGKSQLSFEDIYSLFKDITSGVAYLHAANYIHRDLKPSNCLLHREAGKFTCLISDFGEVQAENAVRKSSGSTGTISYCAPEVLRMDAQGHYGNFTTKSDVFSLGMILYFMCFGRLPYQGANAIQEELEDIEQLRAEITDWQGFQDERRERPDLPAKLYRLLKKLLALDPAERPSANEVLAAMKSESSLDGITRGDRNPMSNAGLAAGLRGNRVQSLDSPLSGGTPTPEARHEHSRSREMNQGDTSPWLPPSRNRSLSPVKASTQPDILQSEAGRRPSQAMTVSRSQAGSREASSMVDHPSIVEKQDRNFSPPLLMAPPRSRAGELKHRLGLLLLQLSATLGINPHILGYVARFSVFFFKMTTLVRPCWPYVASLEVSVPLVVMAALDFGLPTSLSPPNIRRPSQEIVILRASFASGIGTSLVLLVFHFAVLWMARHWNVLCVAVPQGDWIDW